MTMPFVVTYSFEAVLKDGLSGFQNSRPYVVKASKLFGLKIYFQTYNPFLLFVIVVCILVRVVRQELTLQTGSPHEPSYQSRDGISGGESCGADRE